MKNARSLRDPRQSVYAIPVLQRPAIVLLEQIMSERLEVWLAQDRWVMVNASRAWRNLFNITGAATEHELGYHPESWWQENQDSERIKETLDTLLAMGYAKECCYQLRKGDVFLNAWLLAEWACYAVPEYGQKVREMEVTHEADSSD